MYTYIYICRRAFLRVGSFYIHIQARILAYELLDNWSDLLVGDEGPMLRVAQWQVNV